MHKDVSPLTNVSAVLDPPDADHKFTAKVCLFLLLCWLELQEYLVCVFSVFMVQEFQVAFQHVLFRPALLICTSRFLRLG